MAAFFYGCCQLKYQNKQVIQKIPENQEEKLPFIVQKDESVGKNLVQMLRSRKELCPETVLQYVKNSKGEEKKYDTYTYRDVYGKVIEFACALKNLGIKRGDKVGLISDNRREWLITDFAVLSLGASDVPRGCDSMGTEIRFILNFVECQVCFFENQKQLSKVLEKIEEVPSLKKAVLFEKADESVFQLAESKGITVINFAELEESGKKASLEEKNAVEHEIDLTSGSDLATIIFTSGTTGTPKGVMLTHDNYIAQCEVVNSVLTYVKPGDKWLSVLPVWHAFERTINYLIISLKNGIIYSKPIGSVMLEDMAALKPETMCGVPRLWESMAQAFFRVMKKKGGVTLALMLQFLRERLIAGQRNLYSVLCAVIRNAQEFWTLWQEFFLLLF